MNKKNTAKPLNIEKKNICLLCGLCCDGSMFRYSAVLDGDNVAFMKQIGFEFIKVHGKLLFQQPCVALNGKLCTLYKDSRRFKSCRTFSCRLLEQYILEKISYISAVNIIGKIGILRESIKKFYNMLDIGNNENEHSIRYFIRELELCGKLNDLSFRKKYAKQIMDCLVFEELLKRNFYNKTERLMQKIVREI